MYTKFLGYFGLPTNPFQTTVDSYCLYLNERNQAALEGMGTAIQARKGLIVLSGKVGTGKTTLVNELKRWLAEQKMPTAFVFNPYLEAEELFEWILANFGVNASENRGENPLLRLQRWLIEQYQAGTNAVLILDEAQGLPVHMLLEISMLLNHEIAGEKLLQIVLSGGPELDEKLKRPDLCQIRQRVSYRFQTAALTREEAHEYVAQKLRAVRGTPENVMSSEAIDAAYLHSGGIPRVIDLLCEHAMIQGFLQQTKPVPPSVVDEVAWQLQIDTFRASKRTSWPEETPLKLRSAVPPTWSGRARPNPPAQEERRSPWTPMSQVPAIATRSMAAAAGVGEKTFRQNPVVATHPTESLAQVTPTSNLEAPGNSIGIQQAEIKPAPVAARASPLVGQQKHIRLRGWTRQRAGAHTSLPELIRKVGDGGRELCAVLGLISGGICEELGGRLAQAKMWVRQRNLALIVERSKRTRSVVTAKKVPEVSERISAPAFLPGWQENWSSLVRWLRQPVPFLKIHRRVGH